MIDERQQERASLYALELLEGAEHAQFETDLAQDRELQSLVGVLRNASAALAHCANPARPPAGLKDRILASIDEAAEVAAEANPVIRPPLSSFRQFIPWAAAACFALIATWFGLRAMTARSETDALRNLNRLGEITLQSSRQQLEAERIVTQHLRNESAREFAAATANLEQARALLGAREQQLAEVRTQLANRDQLVTEREQLLAAARREVRARESEVTALVNRVDALTGASADVGRQLGGANLRIAQLTNALKTQGDLAEFKITTLASLLKNSPQALAVAVWDPAKQEGVLKIEKLPALAANQDYHLWIVDPQYPNPVDGGVFTVEPASGAARFQFKSKQPVAAVNAFAVTLERKGGVPKAEGPFVLLGK